MMKISAISNKNIPRGEAVKAKDIRDGIFNLIKTDFPSFDKNAYISIAELNKYRRLYLSSLILLEKGELALLDKDVIDAIRNNSILSEKIEDEIEAELTLGQKLADQVAAFGGSWTFIITFFIGIIIWVAINVWFLSKEPFDPYPFILLNLILSCLAAIQAPIIMMSQNRQEQKDRERGEHDYKINLKAELEIKLLSEKIDHLMVNQNRKLLEIQEIQTDYLEDLMNELKKKQ
ncbi:putative membrane protein [Salegentibacter sp. 24]|nr:putative membrane protein [Salegentibacter sp. 24]